MILIFLSAVLACSEKNTADTALEVASQPAPAPPIVEEEESCTDLNEQQCLECFADENPVGYNAYVGHVVTYCYCGVECTDVCVDFCETLDGSIQPSEECANCVNTVGSDRESQCIVDFSAACEEDIDCVSFASDGSSCSDNE